MWLALLALAPVTIDVYPKDSLSQAIAELKQRTKGIERGELRLHGKFTLKEPLVVDGLQNVFIAGMERAEISGGFEVPASAWTKGEFMGHAAYKATFSGGRVLHEAWTEGRRLRRPSLPKQGFFHFADYVAGDDKSEWNKAQSRMMVAPNTIQSWHNLQDVELVAHHLWVTSRLPIKSLDGSILTFTKPSVFRLSDDYTGATAPFTAENVAEAFGDQDQFYIDRQTKTVYVSAATWPDKPKSLTLPALDQLIHFRNCKNVRVKDVTFCDTEWNYPDSVAGDAQAAASVAGAVDIAASENVSFDRCSFNHLGSYGIEVKEGSRGSGVFDCDLTDLGAGGIKVDAGSSNTVVDRCIIEGGGRLHAPAVGVLIFNSGHNTITHNLIADFYYTGVSLGWVWGYGPSEGNHNLVEGNIICDIGQGELSDMGGIYNLGVSPGTVIRRNLIANVQSRGYGGWGVYLDEGSSGVLVEQNAVFATRTGSFHQHYGKENLITHNLFCGAEREGQVIRSRKEDHLSFTLKENVVAWKGTPFFGGNPGGGGLASEGNLLLRQDQAPDRPAFDVSSRPLIASDKATVAKWLGATPGSAAWWNQFGPGRGNWRDRIRSFLVPWIKALP